MAPGGRDPNHREPVRSGGSTRCSQPKAAQNHNLHQESDLVQRFLNVLQPGTYVRPIVTGANKPGPVLSVLWCCKAVLACWCSIAGEVLQRERLRSQW